MTSSVINAYTAKNRRTKQYQHEKPPIDLRRFSGIRLHPKTRAAGLLCLNHLTHTHFSLLAREEALLLSCKVAQFLHVTAGFVAVMGVYLSITMGLAIESFWRTSARDKPPSRAPSQ